MLKIYDTLTRSKREFVPLTPGEVKMYVCGMTVYDHCHLGHARVLVVFDSVVRWLQTLGYKVTYIRNITDIDDKIIRRASENREPFTALTARYIRAMEEDAAALNVISPSFEPRATECIDSMIVMIESLLNKGLAYVANNGDVFYDVHRFTDYGKLSGKSLDDLRAGERVEIDTNKRDPLDFVLWKAAKPDEPSWDSPWGKGRPGWHIECSAMSGHYLGEQFDIHGGGQDLQFPHHENEIAQSEGVHGHSHVNYWMHNGFVRVDNEKMSKSLGNFFTVRDILKEYDGEVLRYFLLSGQYRGPINFSRELMEQSRNALERMKNAKASLLHLIETGSGSLTEEEGKKLKGYESYREKFIEAMEDDLNTADAISAIFELIRDVNTDTQNGPSKAFAQGALDLLNELTGVLGLLWKQEKSPLEDDVQKLIEERQEARRQKDFARSDAIRDELAARGITLKDTPQGVQILRS